MPITLEESFTELMTKIVATAAELNQEQLFLQRFLEKHPDVLSPRIRTAYVQDSMAELIEELIRTCDIAEDNIEMLADVVKCNPELKSAYQQHVSRIASQTKGLAFANRNTEAVINHIAKKIDKSNWSFFGRQLGVPDGEMDEIQDEITDSLQRIEKIFAWAAINISHTELEKKVITALESSKRRDLAEEVQKIYNS